MNDARPGRVLRGVGETGCGDYRLGLGVYALGCLPPPEADELRAHLGGCSACRDELAELRRVTELLTRALPPSGAGAGAAPMLPPSWHPSDDAPFGDMPPPRATGPAPGTVPDGDMPLPGVAEPTPDAVPFGGLPSSRAAEPVRGAMPARKRKSAGRGSRTGASPRGTLSVA